MKTYFTMSKFSLITLLLVGLICEAQTTITNRWTSDKIGS